ncbi:helix-turn-helix domain-containing protein [Flavobacterium sp.]|jgi:transcriptional regulator with XRE-family HTH domain|uniref:helix-turn-helix domain-containing protein n=1 Tax=Flavobacterium sp. TaxID=239 RepID=UPI0037C04FAA
MSIGTRIRKKRTEKGFSQEFLAEKLKISQGTLSNIESNKSKPDIDLLKSISNLLEVDIYDLIEETKLKQVNKDNSVGYLAENQNFQISEKLIEQYEERIKELKDVIAELKSNKQ